MPDRHIPRPVTVTDELLLAIHDRLGEILARIPEPPAAPDDATVELREPGKVGRDSVSAPGLASSRRRTRKPATST